MATAYIQLVPHGIHSGQKSMQYPVSPAFDYALGLLNLVASHVSSSSYFAS
jgi:hypothetical protein